MFLQSAQIYFTLEFPVWYIAYNNSPSQKPDLNICLAAKV